MRKTVDNKYGFLMQRRQSSRNPGWSLSDLDFADDIIELDRSQELLQQALNDINVNGKKIGLEINAEKTRGMIIGKKSIDLELEVNGNKIEVVDKFTYLGTTVSSSNDIGLEIDEDCIQKTLENLEEKSSLKPNQI